MHVGVDYYPEQSGHATWEEDARLMRAAGFSVVRMAEFAWAFLEPEEGRFEFGWLDEALHILARAGISAVLGTPTAAMPAWVARTHPEALAVDAHGERLAWGVRRNNCFSSVLYRTLSQRITRAMADHFRDTSNVIGWQTDNELGTPFGCWCESCHASFRQWLRQRHGSLEALNDAWGTAFWSHRFSDWAEIPIPDDLATHNPGLCLDWRRFNSWLQVRFQAEQVEILRDRCPGHFVTHNLMGLFSELDYWKLAGDLDFVSWDNYPVRGEPALPWDAAAGADLMRSMKRRGFWIMEQTAGAAGWGRMTRNPRPGEMRAIAYQQLGRGAEAQVWFRWDTCTAGREQYWHGLLGHDRKPLRRYREAAQIASEYRRLAPALEGTTASSEVAIVWDYESVWAFKAQPAYGTSDAVYHEAMRRYHRALVRAGAAVDFVAPDGELAGYRVVFAPHLYLLPDERARRLERFVRDGGTLVTDCRTGVKDEHGRAHARTLPGLLSDCLGISIEEYEALSEPMGYSIAGANGFEGRWTGVQFADWAEATTAEVLARWEPHHLAGKAALTRNRYGKGCGYYVAGIVREETFYDLLVSEVLARAGVRPLLKPPSGVDLSVRQGGGRRLAFLVSFAEEPRTADLPSGGTDLLTGAKTGSRIELAPYGVAVVSL